MLILYGQMTTKPNVFVCLNNKCDGGLVQPHIKWAFYNIWSNTKVYVCSYLGIRMLIPNLHRFTPFFIFKWTPFREGAIAHSVEQHFPFFCFCPFETATILFGMSDSKNCSNLFTGVQTKHPTKGTLHLGTILQNYLVDPGLYVKADSTYMCV